MSFSIAQMAKDARKASFSVANLSTAQKDAALSAMAQKLIERTELILTENQKDLDAGKENGLTDAMIDRLRLTPERVKDLANALVEVTTLPDPVGTVSDLKIRPNGMRVGRMRIPLGVIAMIYEARPNVTAEAAALCLKSGNAVILRGGKEALFSNLVIAKCLHEALVEQNIDPNAICVVPDPDRAIMNELMTLSEDIDLIIPRGGEGLIRFVTENSRIPVIQHFKGVCHLYVDQDADKQMALELLLNGKTQRTGVCNALETLLVHQSQADSFLPMAAKALADKGVKIHACERSIGYFSGAELATEDDWHAEYLALEIAIRVVDDFDAAIGHLESYSSGHTEVICTQSYQRANEFTRRVNSAVVMVNASSRFSDGGQLGLGAEIGISTSKLHAYGPMGLESLTTQKFIVQGEGQIRA
ncbi:gamma-glutamyl phosphate reductase [Catenovulum agarivorans DS-2]|uniref:Gamma-glutamyl phosphate reductase n=1 Tax=Catenovulum agarivorans DS-2 TaxID=1328313 RepID=W7QF75_9ALTE|nr:glutamate-5-semialdehyde dehydrogenase [Catenovulum agarivorans]EWH11554.1 gamma-glutamyl phosphate reductase [Catenovulum agarivorans DS-2]